MSETLWYLVGVLFIAVGIGLSIAIHELGHLWPAKAFGVKVVKYMIGFGPTLCSRKRGETEYGIKLIPLGGYIAMIGMYPPAKPGSTPKRGFFRDMISSAREAHSEHVKPGDENRMFYQLPVFKRIIIMLGGPLMNLVFGAVLMSIAIGGIGTYQRGTEVTQVVECSAHKGTAEDPCTDNDMKTPAYLAKLEVGDQVISIAGVTVNTWDDATAALEANVDKQVPLVVQRDGNQVTLELTPTLAKLPAIDESTGQVKTDASGAVVYEDRPFLGVVLNSVRQPGTIGQALALSGSSVVQTAQMITTLPEKLGSVVATLFNGEVRDPNGPISIIGIGKVAGEVATTNNADPLDKLAAGLSILASLNFALFVFNMLPLLPLDGGHVAGGVYEAIKRGVFKILRRAKPGPADTALLMPATWAVFIVLMGMSLLLIVADFVNPVQF